jgi:transposase InsO family protein
MPWKDTCAMEERMKFIVNYQKQEYSKAALCRIFGISRPTGDKWLDRYAQAGIAGLADQSRAPKHHPNQVSSKIEEAILAARRAYPHWGPKKLRTLLEREMPRQSWPAISTIGEILCRHGLTVPRKRRRRTPPYTQPFATCDGPNAVWCGDFKGWFKTGDGSRCDPLTITDAASRYLLRCQAVKSTGFETTRGLFEATFRQYGLPLAIRTDNGSPFASRGIGGLSRLSVWWIKLGIVPKRIEPGKPQQNGRHERMHRTLKAETAKPPARTLRSQQRAFDRFCKEFNHVRPHEALEMATPASVYTYSPRPYPERLGPVEYPSGLTVRMVQKHGGFYWHRHQVFLGEAFWGERIGLEPLDGRHWTVYFGERVLGVFDSYRYLVLPLRQAARAGVSIVEPSGGPSAMLQCLQTIT